MKSITLFSVTVLLSAIFVIGEKASTADFTGNATMQSRILIVYFSTTGNTKALAEEIHHQAGGDLIELVPAIPYPDTFQGTVERHHRERDSGAFPELATGISNIGDYDIAFIGFPNWSNTMPRIMFSFFDQHDLNGKTLIPFCTHGGGGLGRSVQDMQRQCPESTIRNGLGVNGRSALNARNEISRWLRGLGITG